MDESHDENSKIPHRGLDRLPRSEASYFDNFIHPNIVYESLVEARTMKYRIDWLMQHEGQPTVEDRLLPLSKRKQSYVDLPSIDLDLNGQLIYSQRSNIDKLSTGYF
ncbi:hypothetical protein V2G26_003344 [Clonostachys chloroleuca]